ncbi:hypothetical protein Hdeb2414_s0066g00767901 [Helianthus debilis subsp. tardiflorus]
MWKSEVRGPIWYIMKVMWSLYVQESKRYKVWGLIGTLLEVILYLSVQEIRRNKVEGPFG